MEKIGRRKHKECNHREEDIADYILNIELDVEGGGPFAVCVDIKDGKLFMHLPGVLKALKGAEEVISFQTNVLQEALKNHPAFIKSNKVHRYTTSVGKSKLMKSWVFDMAKLTEGIEVTGNTEVTGEVT